MSKHSQSMRTQPASCFLLALALISVTSVSALAADPAAQATQQSVSNTAKLLQTYGQLPLSFEQNEGQADKSVHFLSRGNGFGLFLTGQGAVLTLHKQNVAVSHKGTHLSQNGVSPVSTLETTPEDLSPQIAKADKGFTTDVVRMRLSGANAAAFANGEDRLPGTANYFLGNDPANWHSNIATFSKVRYSSVYPGVDLVYYGNQRQLEYDFVVAPKASVRPIQLHFDGATHLALLADGSLAITAPNGSIAFHKPTIYQTIDGSHKNVSGSFKLLTDNSVGFTIGRYDRARPLVIDPILAYSTYFGGTNAEYVVSVATDSSGNAYVTGLTVSEDFPLTPGAFQAVNYASGANTVSTAFVSKFNPSGTALLYSTYLGGVAISDTLHEQGDYGKAIAVDESGNAYVTGYTYSTDFPITSGAFQTVDQAADIALATGFVTKLNPTGTALVYSTFLGGDLLDEPTAIALDSSGNAYISGLTFSANFPVTPSAFQTTNKSAATNGFNDFVTKLNPTGTALVYSTYLGGGSSDGSTLSNLYWTNPIAVDKSGNAYVEGFTTSDNFPVTSNAFQKTNKGNFNITVTKLNPTGSALLYSTYLGGSTDSISEGLAIDSTGNAYVAGYTSDTNFPVTTGAFQTTNKADTNTAISSTANQNGFITKINPTGSALVYSTYLGGTTGPWGGDQIYGLTLDSSNDVYVTGAAMSLDFPVTSNAYQATNHGATHCCDYDTYTTNAFMTELNPAGSALIYSTYLGGSGTQNPNGAGGFGDGAYNLALGSGGNVYVVGYTTSSNFPVTTDAFETTYHTQQNTGFVADFDLGTAPTSKQSETTLTPSSNNVVHGTSVTFTATVKAVSGTTVPAGTVVFSIDEKTVASVTLSAGKATYSTSALAAGAHYILATYSGSTTFSASGDGFTEYVIPTTPVITPKAGTYSSQQIVSITTATKGAVLYYTLNGATPTVFSTPYTAPIVLNTNKTLEAIAVSSNDASSSVATAAYTIVGSPSVLAEPATAISTPNATLNAAVNTEGLAGSYLFHYGTSKTVLTASTASTALSASISRVAASAKLTALKTKTTYYYQIVVTTAGGACSGAILSFTTN